MNPWPFVIAAYAITLVGRCASLWAWRSCASADARAEAASAMNMTATPTQVKAKHQRLILALLALAAVVGAALLALSALKDQAAFSTRPAMSRGRPVAPGRAVRLGGMVETGSRSSAQPDGVTIHFVVTDGKAQRAGRFHRHRARPVPRRIGRGRRRAVSTPDGSFVATNLLAKHDENYMPPRDGRHAA